MRKAAQHAMAEQRVARLMVEESKKDIRIGLEGVIRMQAETMHYAQHVADQLQRQRSEQREVVGGWILSSTEVKQNLAELYRSITKMLTDAAVSDKARGERIFRDICSEWLKLFSYEPDIRKKYDEAQPRPVIDLQAAQDVNVVRENLHSNSASLEHYFHRDRIRLECEPFIPSVIDPEVLAYLAEWTREQSLAPILLICNSDTSLGIELESPMTILAVKFVDFASASNLPVISYFCELWRGEELQNGNTPEVQGLISVAYALLRQMLEFVDAKPRK
ncbi:hypothetical protein CC78DRAFT_621384 [Lojkania enalia]|uniref:Uncharacterized protein n=1 Tax=Lojkania enalia TaxID=147567 RepID=A0A9P4MVH2_9PLEO|nr:hypothetical protein CC78DRAFT_621384 [Didymosphaeria enalia]